MSDKRAEELEASSINRATLCAVLAAREQSIEELMQENARLRALIPEIAKVMRDAADKLEAEEVKG